jgi:transposase InsO family protein
VSLLLDLLGFARVSAGEPIPRGSRSTYFNWSHGFLQGKRYVLKDRDSKFSREFRTLLQEAGVERVLLPARSPNLNAHLERFHRTLKGECLECLIFFGEQPLRRAIAQRGLYHRPSSAAVGV